MGKGKILTSISASVVVLGLAGCDDAGQLNFGKKASDGGDVSASITRPSATKLVEQDVEAPDVFQKAETGLWDGRPSLGGVWVAHPDVTDPERVIIRNTANGKFVIGALFKRERDNPGPRFQVSSDAAAALGLLAGSPSNLQVTALRRQEIDKAPAPEADPEIAAADPAATSAPGAAEAAGEEPITTAAAEEQPKKKRWSLFGKRKPAEEATAPATDVASAATEAPAGQLTQPEAIETTSLASPLAAADAAIARAENGTKAARRAAANSVITPATDTGATLARAQGAAQQRAQAAALPRAATPKPQGKPYVQIGYFSVEQNASNTATALRQAGIVPTVRKQESQGKTFWRVVAGPVNSAPDRTALLRKVKSLGFEDAYFVTN